MPAGRVFVMGDNRSNSADSRDIGPVDEDKIIGRAFVVILPPRGLRRSLASCEGGLEDCCDGPDCVEHVGRHHVRPCPPRPSCHGRRGDVIVGTEGPDDISGTPRADVIVGRGGSDRIEGKGGDDRICGGAGGDSLVGGGGGDLIIGQGERDLLVGGKGNDRLRGGTGLRDRVSYADASRVVTVDLADGVARGQGREPD